MTPDLRVGQEPSVEKQEDELAALIAEQQADARFGDRVYSVSLDKPHGTSGDRLRDFLVEEDGVREVRAPSAVRLPILGHRIRREQASRASQAPHGSVSRYGAGCRCKPCRWASARRSWDYYDRKRKERAQQKDAS